MKLSFLSFCIVVLMLQPGAAFAVEATTTTTPAVSSTTITTTAKTAPITAAEIAAKKKASDDALTAYKSAKAADKLIKLQALGAKLIDHRVSSLGQLLEMIDAKKGLTAAQIVTYKADVQTSIDELQALKTKIAAATSIDVVKTDVQSIFTYKIYAVYIPKMHITVATVQIQSSIDQLSAMTAKLQAALDAKKAAGADTEVLAAALIDYKVQIADAVKQLAVAVAQLDQMKINDLAASKIAVTTAKTALKAVRERLVAAQGDLTTFKTNLAVSAGTSSSGTSATKNTTTPKGTTGTSKTAQ